MVSWIKQNKVELFFLNVLGIIFTIAVYTQINGMSILFFDTDDYMRLVRIRDFFIHYDLNNHIIDRCNVPYGCNLHWTRFYDFFLIVPSYLLSFCVNSINTAIEYIGFFISPLLKIFTIIFLFKLMQNLFKTRNAFLVATLFAANPIVEQFFSLGRPDHHSFITLFIIIFMNSMVFFIKSQFKSGLMGVALSTVLCIWISPETLIPIILAEAVLLCYTILVFTDYADNILYKLLLKNLILSCLIITIITPAIITEKACNIYYDEISIVHFSLFLYITLFYGIILLYKKNISDCSKTHFFLVSIVIGLIIGCTFLYCYPKFLYGMSADITPFVKDIWLHKVAEMKSPFAHGEYLFFILHAIFVLIAVINKTKEIIISKKNNKHIDLIWLIFIFIELCYLAFAACANRMLLYSTLFSFPLIVAFGIDSKYTKRLPRLLRIVITFFMATLFIFITACFKKDTTKVLSNTYSTKELFNILDNLSDTSTVIMAHSNDGPMLLYYTKHYVVGAPYHRQTSGIIFSYFVMEAEYSEDKVKQALETTNANYIFIRKAQYENTHKNSFAKMIIDGHYPSWITIVKLPKKFSNIIVARINRDAMLNKH